MGYGCIDLENHYTAFSIHADRNIIAFKNSGELLTRELLINSGKMILPGNKMSASIVYTLT